MLGRNISYIIDGNNAVLREFIRRESWRRGVVLGLTAVHDAIPAAGVVLSLGAPGPILELGASDSVELRLQCGLAFTTAGPVVFLAWWVPGPGDSAPLYLQHQLLPPMAKPTLDLLEALAGQQTLFWVLAGDNGSLAGIHEIENSYPFRNLAELVRTLAESTQFSEEEFPRACDQFHREFSLDALIAGRPGHRIVFASEWGGS